jgi:hypothetical protein
MVIQPSSSTALAANNVALGYFAGSNVTTANNVICIGASVSGFNVDNSCFIGNISGAPVGADAIPVLIDSTGKLGTMSSARRFKNEKQEATIAELRQEMAALTAGLQKVNAQPEMNKAASQMVVKNQ